MCRGLSGGCGGLSGGYGEAVCVVSEVSLEVVGRLSEWCRKNIWRVWESLSPGCGEDVVWYTGGFMEAWGGYLEGVRRLCGVCVEAVWRLC